MNAIRSGTIDAIIDEGLVLWFDEALASGMETITLEDWAMTKLQALGWRRVVIPKGRYPHLKSRSRMHRLQRLAALHARIASR